MGIGNAGGLAITTRDRFEKGIHSGYPLRPRRAVRSAVRDQAAARESSPSPILRDTKRKTELFEQIYAQYSDRFHSVAYSILRNDEDANDAVQDAMLSAYKHVTEFEGRSGLPTWFTRIVINASLMLLRRRKLSSMRLAADCGDETGDSRTEQIPAPDADPETLYLKAEAALRLNELINQTSPVLREAFRLRFFAELSTKEGAGRLRIRETTFKARVFRAKVLLSKKIKTSSEQRLRTRGKQALSVSELPLMHGNKRSGESKG